MRLLLDTQIFPWYVTHDLRLKNDHVSAIRNPQNYVYLSVVSQWEATVKFDLGKLPLPTSPEIFIPHQRRGHRFRTLPITEDCVSQLAGLPMIHRDPFDRMLISQAISAGLTIVTVDSMIGQYPVSVIS